MPPSASASVSPFPVKCQIKNVGFYYGKFQAIKDVSLEIPANRVTAFIGPSGCGKSTFLRTFNRLYELYPDQRAEGEIRLDGVVTVIPVVSPRLLIQP